MFLIFNHNTLLLLWTISLCIFVNNTIETIIFEYLNIVENDKKLITYYRKLLGRYYRKAIFDS